MGRCGVGGVAPTYVVTVGRPHAADGFRPHAADAPGVTS